MKVYLFVKDLCEEPYGTQLYITYATLNKAEMDEYATKKYV